MTAILLTILLIGSATAPPREIGSYRLTSVAGRPLPALWQATEISAGNDLRTYWVSGQAELRPDLTYTVTLTVRTVGPGVYGAPAVTTMTGTWQALGGGRIEIRPARGGTVVWLVVADRLRIRGKSKETTGQQPAGMTFEFTRHHDNQPN